ncbi:hypothetical protein BD410DRAFT_327726 [Rickenella mellea]|uniref:Zn(2)-C6 fungal-type domain-containing protein n=1 Tax=Rickenella mellea TaxID=50990 RepID=A0A4Y7QKX9_9AGAM|nr:hypothetical protein BD410DRAFT_327726 [Rickenella mellea]
MDLKGNGRDIRAEQELKRARGALSCAECRRLKLKCDKRVPCSSCQRRGCASICPNGSLTTGQGTRFVLADTERLHRKLSEMSDRIRQLEDALSTLHSKLSRDADCHPLLQSDLLGIKTLQEVHANPDIASRTPKTAMRTSAAGSNDYIDAFGTLAIRNDGAETFYGRSAGSESLLLDEMTETQGDPAPTLLPDDLRAFSEAFPLTPANLPEGGMRYLVAAFLPPCARAWELCKLYLDQAPWFFGAVMREQLVGDLFPAIYHVDRDANGYSDPQSAQNQAPRSPPHAAFGPHDLALLFIVLAIGALTDMRLPPAPANTEAEHYYQLTRAALSLDSVLERAPSVTTVQTLALMAIYQGMALKENSVESTWALMGLATKLAQTIGLHRDSARWKLEPKEVQKRRSLFWELFITDSWQSLATGRPPSFTLSFVDCELPQDQEQTLDKDGTPQPSFPFWKAKFGAECVTAVVEGTLTAASPKYTHILDLDRKIRDLPLPRYADCAAPVDNSGIGKLAGVMKHYMPINYRGFILVYLHRSFFAQALCDHPTDPFRSQYAPSFLAAYEAACSILGALREQFALFPEKIARFWPLWTHAFSSAVIVGSVVTRGPRCKVAPAAMAEISAARVLFEQAARYGGRAVKVLPILVRLHEKAEEAFTSVRCTALAAGMPTSYAPPHAHAPVLAPVIHAGDRDDQQDELSVFGGRTRLVAGQKQQVSPPQPTATASPLPPSHVNPQAPAHIHQQTQRQPRSQQHPQHSQQNQHHSPEHYIQEHRHIQHPQHQHQHQHEHQHQHASQPPSSFENVHPHLIGQLHGYNYGVPAAAWSEQDTDGGVNYMHTYLHHLPSESPSYQLYDANHSGFLQDERHLQQFVRAPAPMYPGQEHRQHTALPNKSATMSETWSSFMQLVDVPLPPTFTP